MLAASLLKPILKFIKIHEVAIMIALGFLLVVSVALTMVGKNWWQEIRRPSIDQQAASTVKQIDDQLYEVQSGDCLWTIAQAQLGSGFKWAEIYQANRSVIGRNPNLLYPQTRLRLPNQAPSLIQ